MFFLGKCSLCIYSINKYSRWTKSTRKFQLRLKLKIKSNKFSSFDCRENFEFGLFFFVLIMDFILWPANFNEQKEKEDKKISLSFLDIKFVFRSIRKNSCKDEKRHRERGSRENFLWNSKPSYKDLPNNKHWRYSLYQRQLGRHIDCHLEEKRFNMISIVPFFDPNSTYRNPV